MNQKKVSKKSKRRLLVFGTMSIVSVLYFFYVIVSYSAKLIKLEYEKKEINEQLIVLREEEDKLKTEIDMLQDPEYIARYARENYLYSKDGEYIIKLQDNSDEDKSEELPNYNKIFVGGSAISVGVLFLVILRIRKKM